MSSSTLVLLSMWVLLGLQVCADVQSGCAGGRQAYMV